MNWSSGNGEICTVDKQKAEDVVARVNNQMGAVVEVNKTACGCGYREKFLAFTKRRESEKGALDKNDADF